MFLAVILLFISLASSAQVANYIPEGTAFVCENGTNRYTRALYGSHSNWRLETSDRPVFATVKKGHHRNISFAADGVALDSTDYCKAWYQDGQRRYLLRDKHWGNKTLYVNVVASSDSESAIWQFFTDGNIHLQAIVCGIAQPKLKRNGDIGVDARSSLESDGKVLQQLDTDIAGEGYLEIDIDQLNILRTTEGSKKFSLSADYFRQLSNTITFHTPDPYINTLGGALMLAADGAWDGKTWLHGAVGWRMPLAGWRAGYLGDVLGMNDRALSHFNAYAKSQVTNVEPVIPHPSQDSTLNLARAVKQWGTQMYSNGYICRNPEQNDRMHHYDMNLNYIDELLWHFQYDADKDYMRKMWHVLKSHLAWEKRNFDPDGDHLYDAYCCIWASDALYYNGGAVTHSSAYNYRSNRLAARIAELIGEDPTPYRAEADSILHALNTRLWMKEKSVWAEYQDKMGLQRLHTHPAVWSIYTPIDCGACTPEQAWQATRYIDSHIPHINVGDTGYYTISTSDWMPYSWSINNVASAEVMHTALAYFEAGRNNEAFRLMKGNILDQMYYGSSPANFGQVSHYDAARGECYRDFSDCTGISSRTLLQGLFGIIPQALYGKCIIRPGFPEEWESASVKTPYLEYSYTRANGEDRYEITQHFSRPLKIVIRQNLADGTYRDIEGTADAHQVITLPFRCQAISSYFNASVTDIFKNSYLSPRPQVTTLQIPTQGISDWCHPDFTADIDDSGLRKLAKDGRITVAGIPFLTPSQGHNIIYTSLWDNYPDAVTISLDGSASSAYLLMAGSTNHMQSRIDNAIVVVTYADNSTDTLALRNPDNWCPIEQDYYIDGKAFQTAEPRPYRICLSNGVASRNLSEALGLQGTVNPMIPGGAAQMLHMPLNPRKQLSSLTLRTLSNDIVVGLMGVTLQ